MASVMRDIRMCLHIFMYGTAKDSVFLWETENNKCIFLNQIDSSNYTHFSL